MACFQPETRAPFMSLPAVSETRLDCFALWAITRTNQRGEGIARQLGEHDVAVSAGRRTSQERPVAVMTMHNAKGLEFTHVILLDVNDEALPQPGALQWPGPTAGSRRRVRGPKQPR
ncbi:hypothetical protein GWO58_02725 [Corynebacterium macginleyi]|nr:hypothetical protein [Corynebacterium macginleyi]MBK4145765.1 hypothetical protein [Corynebacterium macginleyi]